MVDPEKNTGSSKEQWKVPDNSSPQKCRRKGRRRLTKPSARASLTSITSASCITGEKHQSTESLRAMSEEVLVRCPHSTSSFRSTTASTVTMVASNPSTPEKIDSPKSPCTPVPVDDESEIIVSTSISVKTVRTASRFSLVSERSLEIKRQSELKLEKAESLKDVCRSRRLSHQSMSNIQIIEKAHNVVEKGSKTNVSNPKHQNETRTEPKVGKSAEKSGKRSIVLWESEKKHESRHTSAKSGPKQPANRGSLQSAPQKVDNAKTSIITEYTHIIETIKQQNNNLEKIKQDMLSVTAPSVRKSLEKRYFAEENKLNDELVKAMVLQSKCPYEKWPEIPVIPNIYDDNNGIQPKHIMNKARQHITSNEQPERKGAGEECLDGGETTSSDESTQCSSDADCLFKDLLDKVDKINSGEAPCKSSESLNTLITHLLRKRKNHLQHCPQCDEAPKNCRTLKCIDEELCRVCKEKLKQLKKKEARECTKCDCDDSKSSQGTSGHSRPTSSSDDDQSCVSKQDLQSLEDEQISAIIKLTQLGKPEKPQATACRKIRQEDSEISSKKKVKPVSSCEANKLLSVLEKMASELKEITRTQNKIINAAGTCTNAEPPPQNANTHATVHCNAHPINAHTNENPNTCEHSMSHSNASSNASSNTSSQTTTRLPANSETEMVFENHRLKEQLRELKGERDELKLIMREQESQMCDYRNRYLEAKQEIEEQLHHMCQLEKCNECIEDRINAEMKQIQAKFEQNLKRLQACLEAESTKLIQSCKEKEELKEKLTMCYSELHKERSKRNGAGDHNRSSNSKLVGELQAVKGMYKQLENVSNRQKEEIKCLKLELATLRRDTAAILSRSKERLQRQIADFNKRIYELEDELAKERAHSCCATKEKDRYNRLLESSRCETQTVKAQLKTLQAYVTTLCNQLEQLKCKSS